MAYPSRAIKVLERRKQYLAKKMSERRESDKSHNYDDEEYHALNTVIKYIKWMEGKE